MIQRNFVFTTFSLILIMGLLQSYNLFKEYFSPLRDYQSQVSRLNHKVEQEKLKTALLQDQFKDFQFQVAEVLPDNRNGKDLHSYQMRGIASIAKPGLESLDLSGSLREKMKAEFRSKDYKKSSQKAQEMIAKYPTSPFVVEAYFFLAESYFLNAQYQECLDVIDQMVQLFPDQELTGYIMLRMGQILQARNRSEEAAEVFQVIMKSFSQNMELKAQAEKLLKTVEL